MGQEEWGITGEGGKEKKQKGKGSQSRISMQDRNLPKPPSNSAIGYKMRWSWLDEGQVVFLIVCFVLCQGVPRHILRIDFKMEFDATCLGICQFNLPAAMIARDAAGCFWPIGETIGPSWLSNN